MGWAWGSPLRAVRPGPGFFAVTGPRVLTEAGHRDLITCPGSCEISVVPGFNLGTGRVTGCHADLVPV